MLLTTRPYRVAGAAGAVLVEETIEAHEPQAEEEAEVYATCAAVEFLSLIPVLLSSLSPSPSPLVTVAVASTEYVYLSAFSALAVSLFDHLLPLHFLLFLPSLTTDGQLIV